MISIISMISISISINIEEYNLDKNRKILIVLNNTVADILTNKTLNPVVTELFLKVEN